jgi:hypothetical protein
MDITLLPFQRPEILDRLNRRDLVKPDDGVGENGAIVRPLGGATQGIDQTLPRGLGLLAEQPGHVLSP